MASYQYVYVMKDLTKAFAGGREVFKGITLSFLPGVKIGVLGVNGAGKSTLLKIMAGIEKDFGGEAWAAEGVHTSPRGCKMPALFLRIFHGPDQSRFARR